MCVYVPSRLYDSHKHTLSRTRCRSLIPSPFVLQVMVTDDGINPAKLTDTATVRINIIDVNEPPTIAPASRTIDENSAVDTVVSGGVLQGSDPDDGQTLTYTLVEPRTDARDGGDDGQV